MAGKPAARQGDGTLKGGPIVQGSAGVLIGAPSGVACSVCPGGMAVGNPVNPMLGAKVLMNEVDIALPGPMSLTLSRSYSSYQTDTPAPVGLFGPGWQSTTDISLQILDDELIVNDNGGRSIHFELLAEGEISFSRSESLWLARGGVDKQPDDHILSLLWQALPAELRQSPHYYFICNDALGPWWILGYLRPLLTEESVLPQPLSNRRWLQGLCDRFGRHLSYQRAESGDFYGAITGVIDGCGRHYQFELTRIPLPIRKIVNGWGDDSGVRLTSVWLTQDPIYPELPDKPLVRYDYNAQGELTIVYDRTDQSVRQFEYQPELLGRITAHSHIGRPASSYIYDNQGRVITQHNPDGLDYQFDYQVNQTVVTDSLQRQQVYHFVGEKGLRRVAKQQRADSSYTENQYDSNGRLVATLDALGRKTEFELDVVSGNLLAVTIPGELTTRNGYNNLNQQTEVIRPDGSRLTQSYDKLGRLIAESDALNQTSRYHYPGDLTDLPCAVEDAMGGNKQLTWSPTGQLLTYTDCSGKQRHYQYNRWGQLTQLQQEEGLSYQRAYDEQGRLVSSQNAAGEFTCYEYSLAGDLVSQIYPDNSREALSYDSWGRVLSRQYGGLTQQFQYDLAGRLTKLINENGAETAFSYDVMNRLASETGFDGRTQLYQYNLLGQLIDSDDMGLVTRRYYDEAGRLVKRQRPTLADGILDEEQWQYDLLGQLINAVHQSQGYQIGVEFTRDNAGRVIKERQQVIDQAGDVCWQYQTEQHYNPLGVAEQTEFSGLAPVQWHTYGAGHLLGVSLAGQPMVEFERDNLHRERERRFGESQLYNQYDNAGRLSTMQLITIVNPAWRREYQYDVLGQLTGISSEDKLTQYRYDAAGRLSAIQSPHTDQFYRYDPAGNRTGPLFSTPAANHLSEPPLRLDNRLTEEDNFYYTYDCYGNLSEKVAKDSGETHRYQYDQNHRLTCYTRIIQDKAQQTEYCYDPLGRRIGKRQVTEAGARQQHWYGWSGDNLVLTEQDNQRIYTVYYPGSFVPLLRVEGERPSQRIYSLAERLAEQLQTEFPGEVNTRFDKIEQQLRSGELSADDQQWLAQLSLSAESLQTLLTPLAKSSQRVHVYQCDHLGTPQLLINLQGKIEWQIELDAWGNVVREINPDNLYQPIRMQGQHYDRESGLHYNRYRYYDPRQGRYITQDPIGLEGGLNYYNYPLNPISWIDPLGLKACFKKRPLSGFPWLWGPSNNPLDDYFNTEISHEQLFFSDGTNIGFFGDGKMRTDDATNISKYRDNTGPCFDDEEMMAEAVENVGPLPKYKLFGSNCQTWAEKVRKEYIRLEKIKNDSGK